MPQVIKLQDRTATTPENVDLLGLTNRASVLNPQGYVTFVEEYEPPNIENEFVDHTFTTEIPSLSTDLTNGSGNSSWYLVTPRYNYLALQWESYYELFSQTEVQSPNIYIENSEVTEYKAFSGKTINKVTSTFFNEDLKPNFSIKTPSQTEELKNIVFTDDYHGEMNAASKNRNEYPFYVQFDFYKFQGTSGLSSRLKDLSLYDELVKNYISSTKDPLIFNSTEYLSFDLLSWASGLTTQNISHYTIGKRQDLNYLSRDLLISTFFDALNDLISANQRTLLEILSGESCYSEPLFYKIEKVNNTSGEVAQTFWITAKDSSWSMVDTQVKYGQEYTYTQTACIAVLGANVSGTSIEPSLRIIEVPLYSVNCNVVQPPQPKPEIRFSNNKNSTKELKISMTLNANNYDQNFVQINTADEAQEDILEKYNIGNLRRNFDFMIESALFEIYRIDHHPESYLDFSGNKVADVRHSSPSISALFKDKVSIGKEYYYTARAVNSHGFFSNPTPIYKVTLNRDANESFLEVEAVSLKTQATTQRNLVFQKLLQLLPSSLQTIYDLEPLRSEDPSTLRGKLDSISLGIAEEPVWGKTFKFRITSSDTGKKIDLNINVKLTSNKTSEDS